MENETTVGGFNTKVHGTTGWAKFSVPMVAGPRANAITGSVQLHALGELIIDGKVTI